MTVATGRPIPRIWAVGISGVALLAPAGASALAGEPTPSYACGECHQDIYRAWRGSAHSLSLDDPVFLDTYRETAAREGDRVARVCLSCHAPLVEVNGDTDLRRKVTWEGVGCDFCHSLVSVDMSGLRPRMTLDLGQVKRGPIRDASSLGHEVAFSDLHARSLACAPCHEFASADGTPIMTTYSEWLESRAAKDGVQCQECHMQATRAQVVDPRIRRVRHAQVNLHEVPGGHSLDQLHKALGVGLKPSRSGDELSLEVRVTNKGAGHAVPTGMPGRRVILEVQLETSRGDSYRQRRAYEKMLTDAGGAPITRDSGYFSAGVQLSADSRIQADEQRTEQFLFPIHASATAYATVKLHYEHSPRGTEDDRTWITFFSETRVIRPVAGAGTSRDES